MRRLLARLMSGKITRRGFAERMLGMGFGVVTVESILDTVAFAQENKSEGVAGRGVDFRAQSFSEQSPYEQWMAHEGVPINTGYYIPDVRALQVKPWKRLGVSGALIDLEGAEGTVGA